MTEQLSIHDRVAAIHAAGIRAANTPVAKDLSDILGVDFSCIERGENTSGSRTFYIALAGINEIRRYSVHEIRTASSLNKIVNHWRWVQGKPPLKELLTSRDAKKVLRMFHISYELGEINDD
jgi:hypothetical protein